MTTLFSSLQQRPLRIGIVAGEESGDILGAGLVHALCKQYPDLIIEGIGGTRMQQAGARSLFPMEALNVMGLFEVIKHIPRILSIRQQLYRYFCKFPPDVFIGIDAPDFNLTLAKKLHQQGIKTVHYTSPSVWAWRSWRIRKIARAVDLMLTLLPFENTIYEKHQIPVKFVGHPLADAIPLRSDQQLARQQLQLAQSGRVMAILPGSRRFELHYLSKLLIQTAKACLAKYPDLQFVVPLVNKKRRQQFYAIWQTVAPEIPFILVDGQAQSVMAAADVVLLASGTATLECMLIKRPMVVSYRVSAITAWLVNQLLNVRMVALPNLIANQRIVPEYIHYTATVDNLVNAISDYLDHPQQVTALIDKFDRMHHVLRRDASQQAAQAIIELIE